MQLQTINEPGERLKEKHPELLSKWEKSCVILLSRRIRDQGEGQWQIEA